MKRGVVLVLLLLVSLAPLSIADNDYDTFSDLYAKCLPNPQQDECTGLITWNIHGHEEELFDGTAMHVCESGHFGEVRNVNNQFDALCILEVGEGTKWIECNVEGNGDTVGLGATVPGQERIGLGETVKEGTTIVVNETIFTCLSYTYEGTTYESWIGCGEDFKGPNGVKLNSGQEINGDYCTISKTFYTPSNYPTTWTGICPNPDDCYYHQKCVEKGDTYGGVMYCDDNNDFKWCIGQKEYNGEDSFVGETVENDEGEVYECQSVAEWVKIQTSEGIVPEVCNDYGVDNDGDGDIDCSDLDCVGKVTNNNDQHVSLCYAKSKSAACHNDTVGNLIESSLKEKYLCLPADEVDTGEGFKWVGCNLEETGKYISTVETGFSYNPFECREEGWVHPEVDCSDGIDNDEDGFSDCLDIDCHNKGYCEYGTELTCSDGIDNDQDDVTSQEGDALVGQGFFQMDPQELDYDGTDLVVKKEMSKSPCLSNPNHPDCENLAVDKMGIGDKITSFEDEIQGQLDDKLQVLEGKMEEEEKTPVTLGSIVNNNEMNYDIACNSCTTDTSCSQEYNPAINQPCGDGEFCAHTGNCQLPSYSKFFCETIGGGDWTCFEEKVINNYTGATNCVSGACSGIDTSIEVCSGQAYCATPNAGPAFCQKAGGEWDHDECILGNDYVPPEEGPSFIETACLNGGGTWLDDVEECVFDELDCAEEGYYWNHLEEECLPTGIAGLDCFDSDCKGKAGPGQGALCCFDNSDCGEGAICGENNQCIEISCKDGIDGDGDGLTDCEDLDCDTKICSQGDSTYNAKVCYQQQCVGTPDAPIAKADEIPEQTPIFSYEDIMKILNEGDVKEASVDIEEYSEEKGLITIIDGEVCSNVCGGGSWMPLHVQDSTIRCACYD